jgi:hypothetical protein
MFSLQPVQILFYGLKNIPPSWWLAANMDIDKPDTLLQKKRFGQHDQDVQTTHEAQVH